MFSKAHEYDTNVIPASKLYEQGIQFCTILYNAGDVDGCWALMQMMEKDFKHSGRLKNEIAWHLATNPHLVNNDFDIIKKYGQDAIFIMEKEEDPDIDMAYDTMAEIYYRLGKHQSAKIYEEKTQSVAPPERKKYYQSRYGAS